MKSIGNIGAVAVSLAILGWGCGAPQKQFKVTSFPPGATIFLDGEPIGQTNQEKLTVEFVKPYVTIRLEKEGFQTTGDVLDETTKDHLAYNLQEAPNNRRILEVLTNIQRLLEQLSGQIEKSVSEKNK
ncbi:MAG: PEGA domain-containing protein [Planctomycetes bacterium]|nr:PEGA domain-containing protein [Planctomycetota bacterium]